MKTFHCNDTVRDILGNRYKIVATYDDGIVDVIILDDYSIKHGMVVEAQSRELYLVHRQLRIRIALWFKKHIF